MKNKQNKIKKIVTSCHILFFKILIILFLKLWMGRIFVTIVYQILSDVI